MLKTIARFRPFTALAVLSLVVMVLGFELEQTIYYDDGGWGSFVFFAGLLLLAPWNLLLAGLSFVNPDPGAVTYALVAVLMTLVYIQLDRWLIRRVGGE